MREIFRRLMVGRYGFDSFSRFLVLSGMTAILFAWFFQRRKLGVLFYFLGWGLLIYCVFRTFSRSLQKRSAENQKFLANALKASAFFIQHKEYHIYKCPRCKQKIRIPRGKGKIQIRCPKCGERFIRNS